MKFQGYTRENGDVGIRNHLLVISSVVCANDVTQNIANQLNGAVAITHPHGCDEFEDDAMLTKKTLAGTGINPNVGACIVVGLGCETIGSEKVAADIAESGKPVKEINIQKSGGSLKSIQKGVRMGRKLLDKLSQQKREEHDFSELILGIECGGSDTSSGITANPAVGKASDILVGKGGTSILSETPELIGAEHILAERAVNKKVADKLIEIVNRAEQYALDVGVDIREVNPSPGNKEGGLTTLEEKSLGCVHKAGSAPLSEVIEFAEKPSKNGLVVMDTPGQDVESITGMVAGGAQIIIFTTGRGTIVGNPIVPVIKVCSNTATFLKMEDNMDINAGKIIDGENTLEEIGENLFELIEEVVNGRHTKSEILGYGSFGIHRILKTM